MSSESGPSAAPTTEATPTRPTTEETRPPQEQDKHGFERALDRLAAAPDFAKPRYQTEVFRLAAEGLDDDEGFDRLRRQAHRFDDAGVFHAGPWERANRLVPELVGGGLRGDGVYPTVEALSELRLLAIAAGECDDAEFSAAEATRFLQNVVKLNLDLVFGETDSEETRKRPRVIGRARRLLQRVYAEIPTSDLAEQVVDEIEQRAAQRPILVDVTRRLVEHATRIPQIEDPGTRERLDRFVRASSVPTALARSASSLADYRARLIASDADALASEARELGELLQATGLSSGHHAVLLRRVRRDPELVALALGLGDSGRAELERHPEFVAKLIGVAITPATGDAIYGLSQVLERTLLSRPEVAASLEKLGDIDLRSEVRAALLEPLPRGSGVLANGALIAGVLALLGQPLGVGQGPNPTCVAARALSMWSLNRPGYLLDLLVSACRDGVVEIPFEGQPIRSSEISGGVAGVSVELTALDPVSRILVPHLDRLYDEMMKRAVLRGEDPHKWVNPALYGHGVPNGFASIFDLTGSSISGYDEFVRLFYATHHPAYADHAELIYPNPVGIFVTDIHGRMLGYHAISIQRIASDGEGDLRVYFFNPNNEGRQRWGHDVEPTISGHGEVPGESSLPFDHFTAHLYAFHYNPYEVGDGFAVSEETIAEVENHARETWGREFEWR